MTFQSSNLALQEAILSQSQLDLDPQNLPLSPSSRRSKEEALRLEKLLSEVDDPSHLSPELLRRAIALGLWYHVTPFRSALVRVLDIPSSARILEVGCGAGALTRYLGEQGFHVTALETSEELAQCARIRCRDLVNVEVITGFLEHVLLEQRFDFVISVDPTFVESDFFDPGLHLMTLCSKALKSTGTLILAIANPLHTPGAAHVEPSLDHVRGEGAALTALRRTLAGAGFIRSEEYLALPHHAAPRLLINPSAVRSERRSWFGVLKELYQSSEFAGEEISRWWRAVCAEGLEKQLAPGWLVLAHKHSVHSVVWRAGSGRFFVPATEEQPSYGGAPLSTCERGDASRGLRSLDGAHVLLSDGELVAAVLKASQPVVNGVRDYKESLISADKRIDELALLESLTREKLVESREALLVAEERHAAEISSEQEGRRIREAELSLVLKQYHAVGAMCHDMREEGRKLSDMLEELRRRYVASEEWGGALSKRVADAEQELERFESWWVYRLAKRVRRAVARVRGNGAVEKHQNVRT
jgi:2-polyprenyl-3-methyl-5-hydroxy-6-metoxy-1,4-benzoquinol methylase